MIAIIGGGVIGCAVAWELSKTYKDIFLFEKNPGITTGENQSTRNSGVIHSGIYYDQETRPLKAALCVEGNRLLYDFCEDHRVAAIKTGKMVVATTEEEDAVLDFYLEQGRKNGVPGLEKISGEKVRALEPNVRARSALLVPSAGIVDPPTLVYRLHTLADQNGVQFLTGTVVIGLATDGHSIRVELRYPDGKEDSVEAGIVINACGIDTDRVARFFNSGSPYELDPVRGETYCFYGNRRPELQIRGKNVYPTPTAVVTHSGRHFTVGIHLTPTFESIDYPPSIGSTVTVGPKLVPADNRETAGGPTVDVDVFVQAVRPFFPGIRKEDLAWHQSGLQARLKKYPDFVFVHEETAPNLIHLLGIDSPGLTAALAIARKVKTMVDEMN
jgi:L-2-hydroxyglutarate oxidase LhgO